MLVLYQSQDTSCCVKCHQRTCRRTPSPPLAVWLTLHVSLSIFARAHIFERTEQGSGGGGCCLEAAMKDSDEGAMVQYTRRHLSNDGENTSHRHREHITKAQSFKFSLSLSTSPILIRTGKRTFSQPRGSYMNERTQTQRTARHPLLSMSLHRQIHGGQTQTKGN